MTPLSDCCAAAPVSGVSAYTLRGECSCCHRAAAFTGAPEAAPQECRLAGGILWGFSLTVSLFTMLAFPKMPGWSVGLAAIVAAVSGLGGYRITRRDAI